MNFSRLPSAVMQILCLFEHSHVFKRQPAELQQKLRRIDAHRTILITFKKILMVKIFEGFIRSKLLRDSQKD